mgnify:CR=1 FL=1
MLGWGGWIESSVPAFTLPYYPKFGNALPEITKAPGETAGSLDILGSGGRI